MNTNGRLADLGIPHLEMILVEVFKVPPPDLFPEYSLPETLEDLAQATGKPVNEVWNKLMTIKDQAMDMEIDGQTLKKALTSETPPLLLDVREPWEYDIAHLPGSLLLASLSFPELLPRLKDAALVVTICHHGVRSFSAAMYLKEIGVPAVRSLAGGLELWAQTIDPSMARY